MCYTIEINKTREEIESRYGKKFNPKADYRPNYYVSGFSFPYHPVITAHSNEIDTYSWGLIPFWFKKNEELSKIRIATLNARSETIDSKPSFRQAFKQNRCLIPAHGFYEWHTEGREKTPYYIRLKSNEIFSIAGIFDQWEETKTGELLHTFSVVTTRANPLMEQIHNTKKRMPVLLNPQNEKLWVDDDVPLEQLKTLLEPYPEDEMHAHTISKLISKKNVDKNTPELIKPYNYQNPTLF